MKIIVFAEMSVQMAVNAQFKWLINYRTLGSSHKLGPVCMYIPLTFMLKPMHILLIKFDVFNIIIIS